MELKNSKFLFLPGLAGPGKKTSPEKERIARKENG
jgi:hypothetical protein